MRTGCRAASEGRKTSARSTNPSSIATGTSHSTVIGGADWRGAVRRPTESRCAIDLSELQRTWNLLGRSDPLWAVLADPRYHGNRWNLEEFFALGQAEIDDAIGRVTKLGVRLRYDRALDFGCGVGRLTQALCRYFNAAVGIDIAPTMIDLAQHLNKFPRSCTYFLNVDDSLAMFETATFDFVYTRLVLQHMRPELSRGYIAEFFRVLRSGGVTAFQIPGQYVRATHALTAPDPSRLPDAAFNAYMTVSQPMIIVTPSSEISIRVGVQNFSTYIWPGQGSPNPLAIAVRWYDQCARFIAESDGTAPIPQDTVPGQKVHLSISQRAPEQPGFYMMQLDIVQAQGGRGVDLGSPTPYIAVAVFDGAQPDKAVDILPFNAQMEYHGIPRAEIEALVASSGGEVVAVLDDPASNPDWPGHLYVARKI